MHFEVVRVRWGGVRSTQERDREKKGGDRRRRTKIVREEMLMPMGPTTMMQRSAASRGQMRVR